MLKFIDETMRDGPQSMWATRMNTRTMLEAATLIDRTGVALATTASGASFETAVRFVNDDPWERLRLVRDQLPNTGRDVLIRSRNLFGWSRYPDEVVELLFRCLQRNGTDSVKIFDGLNDITTIAAHCRIGKKLGLRTTGLLAFSVSPIHTDEHYAQKARQYADLDVDAVLLCDASGILRAERARALMTALRAALPPHVALEFYAHASMGLSHGSYREAMKAGVSAVTTAALPLANGESLPATVDIARIAEELGIPHGLDMDRVRELDDYMEWATFREGHKPGKINTHDPIAYEKFIGHQIPGGMISNFRNQLREAGLMHRIDEVLEEAGRVREELGFPVMVTPFSQFVGVQATFNVIQGERYKTVPNEVRLFALGYYGNTGGRVDPNALDRILQGKSEDRMDATAVFEEKIVDKFRAEHGPFASDEELLLALFYGKPAVQALNRNKSTFTDGVTVNTPLRVLVSELAKQKTFSFVRIEKGAGAQRLRLNMTYA